ncbi:MAG: immunity 22 family protein [Bacillus sp. (in: firmicutes)]
MEQEGYVSLWVGKFESDKDFQNYLFISYTEDGDSVASEFEKHFQIDYYDEDFMEAEYFDGEIKDIQTLLEGCSYDDVVIPNFIKRQGENLTESVNSVILLYNFQYSTNGQNDLNNVQYVGNVRFK